MKNVKLSRLEELIVRPGIEKHLMPLIMYRGRTTLGDAHRMWNLMISGMEHEATLSDLTQRLQKNEEYSQLCAPNAVKPSLAIRSFCSRLEDNPKVMGLIPGLAEYIDWLVPWYKRIGELERVSEISHRSRNLGAGGWRTFQDDRVKPPPEDFADLVRGMTATELTRHYGVCFQTVSAWRRKLGVAAYRKPKKVYQPVPKREMLVYPFLIHDAKKPEHSLLRRVNDAVPKGLDPSLRADMCQDLIVGILAGDLAEDDLHLPSRELIGRVFRMSTPRYGDRSLDAIMGEGDFSLMDTLADEGRDWA